ncbi:MAG: cupin domain-containing protein [Pseudomonadales bacterium]|nr:cupin domain-containing protein [Pseudomonadales bacterium]MCP5184977.1 cupin domain-containing protein [Pseudomonadales bacterium]
MTHPYIVSRRSTRWFATESGAERFCSTLDSPLLTTAALWRDRYRLAPGASNPLDTHTVDEIFFVTEGTAQLTLNGEVYRVAADETALLPARTEHPLAAQRWGERPRAECSFFRCIRGPAISGWLTRLLFQRPVRPRACAIPVSPPLPSVRQPPPCQYPRRHTR